MAAHGASYMRSSRSSSTTAEFTAFNSEIIKINPMNKCVCVCVCVRLAIHRTCKWGTLSAHPLVSICLANTPVPCTLHTNDEKLSLVRIIVVCKTKIDCIHKYNDLRELNSIFRQWHEFSICCFAKLFVEQPQTIPIDIIIKMYCRMCTVWC